MNTIPHPDERTRQQRSRDKKKQTAFDKRMRATEGMLLRLGFKKLHHIGPWCYVMPEHPDKSLLFTLDGPIESVTGVLEWVCAWGYKHGCAAAKKNIREALDIP